MRGIRSLFAGAAALSVPTMACAFAPPSVLSRSRLVLTATIETAVNGATDVDPSSRGFPFVAPIRLTATEKARTVTSLCTSGTLCTSSRAEGIEGAPFGSHVDYVLDDRGSPILLMNEMSMHTANILERPDAVVSLFTQIAAAGDGQDAARCSITGRIERMGEDEDDAPAIRMRYSISHSYADQVMDSPKFHFYRLVPLKIYYVGGFGVSSTWVSRGGRAVARRRAPRPVVLTPPPVPPACVSARRKNTARPPRTFWRARPAAWSPSSTSGTATTSSWSRATSSAPRRWRRRAPPPSTGSGSTCASPTAPHGAGSS
mmetsp:Transcript_4478/g.9383  ORF Transcript_4478/g.9383 Transcript_4478/m.9383 type:complete len:316 (+) Transcript_4478:251-1198(+)